MDALVSEYKENIAITLEGTHILLVSNSPTGKLRHSLEAAGKSDEAFACYAEAVRLKPNYPEGQYDLGSLLMKSGRLEDVVLYLSAAVKNNPTFAYAHINLGKALLEQGKLDVAADHLSKAVRLTPDDAEV